MEWGASQKLWQRMMDEGREPPAAYYNQPELLPNLLEFWDAFNELGTERQIGMGVGPIPISKIRDHIRDEIGRPAGDATERVVEILRRVDSEYLSLVNDPKNKTTGKDKSAFEVDASNGDDVKALMDGIATRQRAKAKRDNKKKQR